MTKWSKIQISLCRGGPSPLIEIEMHQMAEIGDFTNFSQNSNYEGADYRRYYIISLCRYFL